VSLESNELRSDSLRLGAELAAAGQTLGLSPEETFNLKQYLADRDIKEVRPQDNAPDPFGEAVELIRDDVGLKKGGKREQGRRPQDDFRPAAMRIPIGRDAEREANRNNPGRVEYRDGRRVVAAKNLNIGEVIDRGIREEKVGAGALPDEYLTPAERENQADAFRKEPNQAELLGDRKISPINPGAGAAKNAYIEQANKKERANQKAQAGRLVAQDAATFTPDEIEIKVKQELQRRFGAEHTWGNPVRALPIDAKVKAEAEIRKSLEGRGGVRSDLVQQHQVEENYRRGMVNVFENPQGRRYLENMGEIQNLGNAGVVGVFEDADVIRPEVPNAPDTAQNLNAPSQGPLPRGQAWMVGHLPGPDVEVYPGVGIMEEGRLLADRAKAYGLVSPKQEIRNIDEFEGVIDAVIAKAVRNKDVLGHFDADQGKYVKATTPGVEDALYKLGYAKNEVDRLANAMYQVEMQRRSPVNQTEAELFAERVPQRGVSPGVELVTNVARMREDAGTPLERLGKGQKVGKQNARAEVARIGPEAILKALEEKGELYTTADRDVVVRGSDNYPKVIAKAGQRIMLPEAADAIAGADAAREDAKKPFIGAIQGELPRAQFIRGDVRAMSPEERRAKGRANPAAEGVERRFLAGEQERAQREAARGTPVQIGRGAKRNPTNVTQGPNVSLPANYSPKQPIEQAPVPRSIAPDPWAGTGPARADVSIQREAKGRQQLALPPGRSPREMPASMREELFALPNRSGDAGRQIMQSVGQQENSSDFYMNSPDGPTDAKVRRQDMSNRLKRGIRGRQVGAAAAIAGGAAGLTGLINGERDRREQEQYQ
jgi:hypothetical protein